MLVVVNILCFNGIYMKSKYWNAICEEMKTLATYPKTIFLGQQVASEDFYGTLKDIPLERRLELPVAEEMQLGLSIGLALEGYLPISIYQRIDFLPRAMDQFVNHLNLIDKLSRGLFKPKVIIRTTIGSNYPFNVGLQHNKDLSELIEKAVDFPVILVFTAEEVHNAYETAMLNNTPTIIIESQDAYNE
jgi:pyruvate/2-oxoglutarate/acetoin dehydrogenase E1 component